MRSSVVAKKRPLASFVTDTAAQERIWCRKVHRKPLALDELNIFIERERPAAGGDDRPFEVARRAQNFALPLAEIRFPLLREELLDRCLLARLDELIEVEEGSADARRQLATDGRLAGAHEADEVGLHRHTGTCPLVDSQISSASLPASTHSIYDA